jgi:hypothetical protein
VKSLSRFAAIAEASGWSLGIDEWSNLEGVRRGGGGGVGNLIDMCEEDEDAEDEAGESGTSPSALERSLSYPKAGVGNGPSLSPSKLSRGRWLGP